MPLMIRPALSRLALLVVIGLAVLGLHAPTAAHANDQMVSIMMDDDLLVYRDDATRDFALRRMKALGVDYVRVTLLWSVVAEGARKTKGLDKRFRRLGADNPKAYPKLNWDRYDRLVRAGRRLGIGIYFNVTGPGPEWGHKKPPASQRRNRRTWMPKAREYKLFVKAVGKRYSGTFRDENDEREIIPRVFFWSLWNEPNQGGWLTPQWRNGRPYSPVMYRQLYHAGYQGLVATGHRVGTDIILAGETAPLGSDARTARSPMRPKTFIRALFCEGGDSGPGCSDFAKYGPIQATGWGHHPYTKKLAPNQRDVSPESVTMANIGELAGLLDELSAKTRHIRQGLTVWSTEFGYETNPPDPFSGISLDQQAFWLTLGDWIAYKDPRVVANTQFLLNDVAPLRKHKKTSKAYWFTYQSGLYTRRGGVKPSVLAYTFPFLAFNATDSTGQPAVAYWGMLRFRPNDIPAAFHDKVQLQFLPADRSTGWTDLGEPITVSNGRGFFEGTTFVPQAGLVRALWLGGNPPVGSRVSQVAAAPAPPPPPAPEPPAPPPPPASPAR
jgi:hypothetical protein